MGIFGKIGKALSKTRGKIGESLRSIRRAKVLDESVLDELEEALIVSDMGISFASKVVSAISKDFSKISKEGPDALLERVKSMILSVLQEAEAEFPRPPLSPMVVMVVGVNGTGKTTTIGKISKLLVDEGRKVLIVAADTFRAAASEQLEVWAERAGASIFKRGEGSDPSSVVYDGINHAVSKEYDVVLVDTAGRIHTKDALMRELGKIKRVSSKVLEGAPHEVLLVLDATTGQNGITQAEVFLDSIGVTGIVVTKLDGTAKGGVLIPIVERTHLPIYFVGTGEGISDISPFSAKEFVDSLFEGVSFGGSKEET